MTIVGPYKSMATHLEPAPCFSNADGIPAAAAGLNCLHALPAFACPNCLAVLLRSLLISLAAAAG